MENLSASDVKQSLVTTVLSELRRMGISLAIRGVQEWELPQKIIVEQVPPKDNRSPPAYNIMPADNEHELYPTYHSLHCGLPTESAAIGISISPDSERTIVVEWQANLLQRWGSVYQITYKNPQNK